MPGNVTPKSFPTWRIDPYNVDSRARSTAEEADGLGNNDGQVTKAEIELLASRYEDMGHSSSADVVRGEWAKLAEDGVSNPVAAAPGAVFRGVVGLLSAATDSLFENVR
jgi:hypothetical protein